MAKVKNSKPDPALVREVAGEIQQQLEAQHAGQATRSARALPKFGKVDLGALLPTILTASLEVAGMARDGKIDPAEAREVGGLVFDLVSKLLSKSQGAAPGV